MVRTKDWSAGGAPDSETMSLDELAARLGISRTTAYELAARDALPIPRIPGLRRYRYSRRLLDRLLDSGSINESPSSCGPGLTAAVRERFTESRIEAACRVRDGLAHTSPPMAEWRRDQSEGGR